jgi:hypothetical protein
MVAGVRTVTNRRLNVSAQTLRGQLPKLAFRFSARENWNHGFWAQQGACRCVRLFRFLVGRFFPDGVKGQSLDFLALKWTDIELDAANGKKAWLSFCSRRQIQKCAPTCKPNVPRAQEMLVKQIARK